MRLRRGLTVLLSAAFCASAAACGGTPSSGTAVESSAAGTESAAPSEAAAGSAESGENGGAQQTAAKEPVDLETYLMEHSTEKDGARTLPLSNAHANAAPVTGYYSHTLPGGRSVKLYIPEYTALRAYITVIAVPDGTGDVWEFLNTEGWIAEADRCGEMLFVMEPGEGGWSTAEAEAEYFEACLAETVGNTAGDSRQKAPGGVVQSGRVTLSDGSTVGVFSGHSCNYYVGYGKGCAPLEAWTARNPLYVIAQALIGGDATDEALSKTLEEAGQRSYNGINNGSYGYGLPDDEFRAVLKKLKEDGDIQSAEFITNREIPVPTLFAGYAENDASVAYWKEVNHAYKAGEDGVFYELNSAAWQTQYANGIAEVLGDGTHGISSVALRKESTVSAKELRAFLAQYTRYTNPFAYSNTLALRTDYYEIARAARIAAEQNSSPKEYTFSDSEGKDAGVRLLAMESGTITAPVSGDKGSFYTLITAFNDYDGDGKTDPRECIMYIPEKAKQAGAPVPLAVVFPGMTQSMSTFMDCSGWWFISNRDGVPFIILGEYTKGSPTTLVYGDFDDCSDFNRSALYLMENVVAKDAGIAIDTARIYATGHSFGSYVSQTLAHTTDNRLFAAVASTSFPNSEFEGTEGMPSYLMIGQADISEKNADSIVGDLVPEPWESADGEVIYGTGRWIRNAAAYNGLETQFTANDKESFLKSCSSYDESGRYHTYTWSDESGAPLVQFGRTICREHNCIPQEFLLAWRYLERFSNENGVRRYSESAFAADDAVEILKKN